MEHHVPSARGHRVAGALRQCRVVGFCKGNSCFNGNVRESSERRGEAHNYGLFRAHRYRLELN